MPITPVVILNLFQDLSERNAIFSVAIDGYNKKNLRIVPEAITKSSESDMC